MPLCIVKAELLDPPTPNCGMVSGWASQFVRDWGRLEVPLKLGNVGAILGWYWEGKETQVLC